MIEIPAGMKPCPFCGKAGDIESRPSYSQAANTHTAYRGWCDHCGYGLDWHNRESDAIAAWNTRTPTPSPEIAEQLMGEVEHGGSNGYATDGQQGSSGRPEWTGQEPDSTDTTTRLRSDSDQNRRADTAEQAYASAGCDGPEDTIVPAILIKDAK